MTIRPPPTRRRFTSERDEIDYLYHKLLHWLYARGDRRRALLFAQRLERLLKRCGASKEAIFAEECGALICEARRDWVRAIRHRENEIQLIRRLHDITLKTPNRDLILGRYGWNDLSDRLDLLAALYRECGDLDRAIHALRDSQRLCAKHGIPFDGQDMLDEYLREKESWQRRARPAS